MLLSCVNVSFPSSSSSSSSEIYETEENCAFLQMAYAETLHTEAASLPPSSTDLLVQNIPESSISSCVIIPLFHTSSPAMLRNSRCGSFLCAQVSSSSEAGLENSCGWLSIDLLYHDL